MWNIEKKLSGRQASDEAQREKERQRDRAEGLRSYLSEEQHEIFLAAVRKWEILAATKWKWASVKSEQQQVQVFGSFTLWSCKTTAKNEKKCATRAKLFFVLIRPIIVFSPFSLPSPLSQ